MGPIPDCSHGFLVVSCPACDRANEVARQAWEIADQRAQRIAELETEVAALTETLRTLFKSAAQPPAPPVDAVEFPANALSWSR